MSWESIRQFPARKVVGAIAGFLGGIFAIGFLSKSFIYSTDVPTGVIELITMLFGSFGAYAVSSVVGDFSSRGDKNVMAEERHESNVEPSVIYVDTKSNIFAKIVSYLVVFLIGIILCSLIFGYYTLKRSARVDTTILDQEILTSINSADVEKVIVQEHRESANTKVVYIRDSIRAEVKALDPDGLADFAINEINIYRSRRSGDSPQTSTTGLGSN